MIDLLSSTPPHYSQVVRPMRNGTLIQGGRGRTGKSIKEVCRRIDQADFCGKSKWYREALGTAARFLQSASWSVFDFIWYYSYSCEGRYLWGPLGLWGSAVANLRTVVHTHWKHIAHSLLGHWTPNYFTIYRSIHATYWKDVIVNQRIESGKWNVKIREASTAINRRQRASTGVECDQAKEIYRTVQCESFSSRRVMKSRYSEWVLLLTTASSSGAPQQTPEAIRWSVNASIAGSQGPGEIVFYSVFFLPSSFSVSLS